MKNNIKKLNDNDLDMISGGKTNRPGFPDETPSDCPNNLQGQHTFVIESNSEFEEKCIFCGCTRRVNYTWSAPHKPTRT